ncbi:MAG: double-strand break repair protein AddB [Pseudomonadota bacterium]
MFEPQPTPRVFGTAPGVDFAQSLVDGLTQRSAGLSPAALARTTIYVNTARMQRRIREVFDQGPARLLPQIRLITDLASDPVVGELPNAVSPLQRRLELAQFVSRLIAAQPDLAPRTSLYALADSLAKLMDEMQGEGVTPAEIAALDVSDQSGHWARALEFLQIITPYFDQDEAPPDPEARQRLVIAALAERWAATPPKDPVIIAGSTGSRGSTLLFMQAVAKLPQGAIILPGFDFDLPAEVWRSMDDAQTAEDHPQFRFRRLMDTLGFGHGDVSAWSSQSPAAPARNALISLSLRPAPVTDQWLEEGPKLQDIAAATEGLTLVEAESPRAEAEAIALRLRQAAAEGQTAALISPDRVLTRQVTAALDRWGITPDDSAGVPLALSPPGRFLRHIADRLGTQMTGEALLTLLKHPLCHSGRDDRGEHLRHARELELDLRRHGPPFPTGADLAVWAKKGKGREGWATWLGGLIDNVMRDPSDTLSDRITRHLEIAAAFCAGPDATGSGALWEEAAGREALRVCTALQEAAPSGGAMNAYDYRALFSGVIADGVVRDRDAGDPRILIWGTLEARVQGVDVTILGNMNDGVWPESPAPDPWLNRAMRLKAELLLPERRIGLSAHDYQQAVAGRTVWITRAKRSADAETVPSRWINRLTNLLEGLPDQGGKAALTAMRARGEKWLAQAALLTAPKARVAPAQRPAPCPPVVARPKTLSVTQIKTLVRDPYAIFAQKVLRLKPLDPLTPTADAALRGTIVHGTLERFIRAGHGPDDRDALLAMAAEDFTAHCPWPTVRAQWMAGFTRIVDAFLTGEAARQAKATDPRVELNGAVTLAPADVKLVCKADRIDLTPNGAALIYDYKTGTIPSTKQQKQFDKQLLLEAAMVERGGFAQLGHRKVADAIFVAVNTQMRDVPAPLDEVPADQVWDELGTLMSAWQDPTQGYIARRAYFLKSDQSDYDNLSRYGEWDDSMTAVPEVLT